MRRSAEALKALEKEGIHGYPADLLRDETLTGLPSPDVIIITLAPHERSPEAYRQTYLESISNLLKAFVARPPGKILYVSSTSVMGAGDGSWVDERTPVRPDNVYGEILFEAEKQVGAHGCPALHAKLPRAVVFRLGGIYGPGRNRMKAIRQGALKVRRADHYLNLIHLEDIVGGIILLLEKGVPGEVYLGVDDAPTPRREMEHNGFQKK